MYVIADKHPGVLDVAYPDRVKGWKPPHKGLVFPVPPNCKDPEHTGATWPMKNPDKGYPGQVPICCGEGCVSLECLRQRD